MEVARHEADFVIKGVSLDPHNESSWQYLIGILREQLRQGDPLSTKKLLEEYEARIEKLRVVVEEATQNSDTCVNLMSARVDLLEMIGDKDSLEKVSRPDVEDVT